MGIMQKPIIQAPRWVETRGFRESPWLLQKSMHAFLSHRPWLFLCLVFIWASWWLSSHFYPWPAWLEKALLQNPRGSLFVLPELFKRKFSLPASCLNQHPVGSGSLHPCRRPQLQPRNSNTSGTGNLACLSINKLVFIMKDKTRWPDL